HQLTGERHDASDARLDDEEVVSFLGEHEAARAGQRIEPALGEARELVLAVAVGEVREHQVREPVRSLLVEGPEDPRLVAIPRSTLQERPRLRAAVATQAD